MFSLNRSFAVGFAVLLALTLYLPPVVAQDGSDLPYYGMFLYVSGVPLELPETRGGATVPVSIVTGEPVPRIYAWLPDPDWSLMTLNENGGAGRAISFYITPLDNGKVILTPDIELANGVYCYVQGNPALSYLSQSSWCFEVSTGIAPVSDARVALRPPGGFSLPGTGVYLYTGGQALLLTTEDDRSRDLSRNPPSSHDEYPVVLISSPNLRLSTLRLWTPIGGFGFYFLPFRGLEFEAVYYSPLWDAGVARGTLIAVNGTEVQTVDQAVSLLAVSPGTVLTVSYSEGTQIRDVSMRAVWTIANRTYGVNRVPVETVQWDQTTILVQPTAALSPGYYCYSAEQRVDIPGRWCFRVAQHPVTNQPSMLNIARAPVAPGEIMVVYGTEGDTEIYLVNLETLQTTQLTDNESWEFDPAWSPDGSRIAFISDAELYVMNADGSDQRRITTNDTDENAPSWTLDGRQILFTSPRPDGYNIYLVDLEGRETEIRTAELGLDFPWRPKMSPDGERIAVAAVNLNTGWRDIVLINVGDQQVTSLTADPATDWDPTWSPDGRTVIFTSDRGGSNDVYAVNADGSNLRQLTDDPANDGQYDLSWSPDGTLIAFISTRYQERFTLHIMNADGTNVQTIPLDALGNGYTWTPAWRPSPSSSQSGTAQLPFTLSDSCVAVESATLTSANLARMTPCIESIFDYGLSSDEAYEIAEFAFFCGVAPASELIGFISWLSVTGDPAAAITGSGISAETVADCLEAGYESIAPLIEREDNAQ